MTQEDVKNDLQILRADFEKEVGVIWQFLGDSADELNTLRKQLQELSASVREIAERMDNN